MKIVQKVEDVINPNILKPGSVIYCSGNAATPKVFLNQMARDTAIRDIEMLSVLLLGDVEQVFSDEACNRITHRIIFNGPHSRRAVSEGHARYQVMHLSDVPKQLKECIKPNVAMLSVAGPDNGGNYSLGCTIEGVVQAVRSAKENGGVVIAERNCNTPFILGATISQDDIDFLLDVDYDLPASPVKQPDETALRIGRMITARFIEDGSTLQYGIGEVPEAVTQAIMEKGVKDLGIRTELFTDAMRILVQKGIVTNRYLANPFSVSTLFLSGTKEGYGWLHFNSSIQGRPSNKTNSVISIARHPKMVAINSAIGVDLHGNIWADSLMARKIYSGVGGQADFLRGAYLSPGGTPIIAMKSQTSKGLSKILDKCPEGITTTAIAADPVMIVTEQGVFDPRGLSMTEHAVAIAHLAAPRDRDDLLSHIFNSGEFHNPKKALCNGSPKGFTPYDQLLG